MQVGHFHGYLLRAVWHLELQHGTQYGFHPSSMGVVDNTVVVTCCHLSIVFTCRPEKVDNPAVSWTVVLYAVAADNVGC